VTLATATFSLTPKTVDLTLDFNPKATEDEAQDFSEEEPDSNSFPPKEPLSVALTTILEIDQALMESRNDLAETMASDSNKEDLGLETPLDLEALGDFRAEETAASSTTTYALTMAALKADDSLTKTEILAKPLSDEITPQGEAQADDSLITQTESLKGETFAQAEIHSDDVLAPDQAFAETDAINIVVAESSRAQDLEAAPDSVAALDSGDANDQAFAETDAINMVVAESPRAQDLEAAPDSGDAQDPAFTETRAINIVAADSSRAQDQTVATDSVDVKDQAFAETYAINIVVADSPLAQGQAAAPDSVDVQRPAFAETHAINIVNDLVPTAIAETLNPGSEAPLDPAPEVPISAKDWGSSGSMVDLAQAYEAEYEAEEAAAALAIREAALTLEVTQFFREDVETPPEPSLFDHLDDVDQTTKLNAWRALVKKELANRSKAQPVVTDSDSEAQKDASSNSDYLDPPVFELRPEDIIDVPLLQIDSPNYATFDASSPSVTPQSTTFIPASTSSFELAEDQSLNPYELLSVKDDELADELTTELTDLNEAEAALEPLLSLTAKPLTPALNDEPLVLVDAITTKEALSSSAFLETNLASPKASLATEEALDYQSPAQFTPSPLGGEEPALNQMVRDFEAQVNSSKAPTSPLTQTIDAPKEGSTTTESVTAPSPLEALAMTGYFEETYEGEGQEDADEAEDYEDEEELAEALADNLDFLPYGQLALELVIGTFEQRFALNGGKTQSFKRAY
jgi:hypothetical protein